MHTEEQDLLELVADDELPVRHSYCIGKTARMVGNDLYVGYAVPDECCWSDDLMGEDGTLTREADMETALVEAGIDLNEWLEENPVPLLLAENSEIARRFVAMAESNAAVQEWVRNNAYPGALQDPDYLQRRLQRWLRTLAENPDAGEVHSLLAVCEESAKDLFLDDAIARRAIGNPYAVLGKITGQNDHFVLIEDELEAKVDRDAWGRHYVVWKPHHAEHEKDIDSFGKTLSVGSIEKVRGWRDGWWKTRYQAQLDPEFGGSTSPEFETLHEARDWLTANAVIPAAPSGKGRRRAAIWHARWFAETYNQIRDGEVYCAVVARYAQTSSGDWEPVDHEVCGGAIGEQWAKELIDEMMPSHEAEQQRAA